MKPRDIQRGIVSPHARQGSGGADIGRVSKVRGMELEPEELRGQWRNSQDMVGRGKKVLWWSICLGTVSAAVLTLAFWLWLSPNIRPGGDDELNSQGRPFQEQARIFSKFPSPSSEEAVEMVKRVVGNRDVGQVANLVWPGNDTPAQIVDYFAGMEDRDGPVESYRWLSSMDSGTVLIDGVMVTSKGNQRAVERIAFLTPDDAGHWKMDFDSFARTTKPSWEELLDKGAAEGLVRVMVMPDVYYNAAFADENTWVCYSMLSPDREELLRGYCKKDSELADEMRTLFDTQNQNIRTTLQIRRLPGGEPRQFEITKIVAKDWMIPPTQTGKP